MAWPSFFPQDHVSCWVALDDGEAERCSSARSLAGCDLTRGRCLPAAYSANGCMTVLPQSFKWGPVERSFIPRFLEQEDHPEPVEVELPAGHCMFHHGLNFHRTGANATPHRRRGLAIHYMRASTLYLPSENEEARMLTECEQPPGTFRFMRIRGREFAGRM